MNITLTQRTFAILSAGMAGYVIGWIWGWCMFDPNWDLWALFAFIGTLAGMVAGMFRGIYRYLGMILCAAFGLYLTWLLRTLIFGDITGGWSLMVLIFGMLAGAAFGARQVFRMPGAGIYALQGAILIGFSGGLVIMLLSRNILVRPQEISVIYWNAPATLVCGVIGALVGWRGGRDVR
jgi:hypothetical protein